MGTYSIDSAMDKHLYPSDKSHWRCLASKLAAQAESPNGIKVDTTYTSEIVPCSHRQRNTSAETEDIQGAN